MPRIINKRSTVSARAPVSGDLAVGEIAVNTADQKIYSKHSDNSIVRLGVTATEVDTSIADRAPKPYVGEIRLLPAAVVPTGWAVLDGALLNISTYPVLAAILGTAYGGDGVTTFGLPDMRGRVPVVSGSGAGLSAVTVGETGGVEDVTLTEGQLPIHSHTANVDIAIPANDDPSNTNTVSVPDNTRVLGSAVNSGRTGTLYNDQTPNTNLASFNETVTVDDTGNGDPISVRNPYFGMNFVIALDGYDPRL